MDYFLINNYDYNNNTCNLCELSC